jgi:K+-H+ exchange-related protein
MDSSGGTIKERTPEECTEMPSHLDLYLIPTRKGRYVIYSRPEVMEVLEAESGHRIRQAIAWIVRHPYRIVAWVGRALNSAYNYYVKLEDRIDPQERVLKAIGVAERFTIHFIRKEKGGSIGAEFYGVLRRQRLKHIFWFAVDLIVSGVVVVFTPFLAPIPGPNVFFYYPFLRLLSHYQALRGTKVGLAFQDLEFKSLPGVSSVTDNPGLTRFLERMD